jgi:hypothetical protein
MDRAEQEPVYVVNDHCHSPHKTVEYDVFSPDLPQIAPEEIDHDPTFIICGLQGPQFNRYRTDIEKDLQSLNIDVRIVDTLETRLVVMYNSQTGQIIIAPWQPLYDQNPSRFPDWTKISQLTLQRIAESSDIGHAPTPRQLIRILNKGCIAGLEKRQITNALKRGSSVRVLKAA